MFFQWISGGISTIQFVFVIITLIIALSVHEFSHGFVAHMLGDNTAKAQGRMSLNPLKHIDPFGFVAIMLVGFGWAKPVFMNPYNFKNMRDGISLTALAGPVSNLLMAVVGALLLNFSLPILLAVFIQQFIYINVILATFNILPFPPLDGFKVFGRILPDNLFYKAQVFEQKYGFYLILILLVTGVFRIIWYPIFNITIEFISRLSNIF